MNIDLSYLDLLYGDPLKTGKEESKVKSLKVVTTSIKVNPEEMYWVDTYKKIYGANSLNGIYKSHLHNYLFCLENFFIVVTPLPNPVSSVDEKRMKEKYWRNRDVNLGFKINLIIDHETTKLEKKISELLNANKLKRKEFALAAVKLAVIEKKRLEWKKEASDNQADVFEGLF